MNSYSRNTILYSILTVSVVSSYWLVRQDAQYIAPTVSSGPVISIDEPASFGYDEAPSGQSIESPAARSEILASSLKNGSY